jgi:nitroimidazol reductase NimA-like FMN-containing flavoprotein (pyridoxamine 5'-phosphate oxidase superfamily)
MNVRRFIILLRNEVVLVFREMRRKKQVLSVEETIQVLQRGTSGVLAVAGDDDYPYAVPLSYVYHDNKIYFHCARSGHKLDSIARHEKVSFCVIDQDQVVPEEYTSYFRSVIVFGKARILEDEAEKRSALEILAARYSPDHEQGRLQEIEKEFNAVRMIELAIDHMSGKEAMELVKAKRP